MIIKTKISVRPANLADRQQLASLIHFEPYVHRHLDWRAPLDWLGSQPFLIAERSGVLVAALACPADPPEVSWIRMFAVAENLSPSYAWHTLWPAVLEELNWQLNHAEPQFLAAIPLQTWFRQLLDHSKYTHTHDVVMLAWEGNRLPHRYQIPSIRFRPMTEEYMRQVILVDGSAFSPLWRNSVTSLKFAFRQSLVSTIVEDQNEVVGYQITTPSPSGAHLARLAVHPSAQRQGIGYAILHNMLDQLLAKGISRVTVNTQHDNYPSLALYKKAGFIRTNEKYPICQYFL